MALSEKHGAEGRMWLRYEWDESSSGHVEYFDNLELRASKDGKSVILVKELGTRHFLPGKVSDYGVTSIKISVDSLVKYIDRKGKRIKSKA